MPIDVTCEAPSTLRATVREELSELGLLAKRVDDFGLRNDVPANAIFYVNFALDEFLPKIFSNAHAELANNHEIRVIVRVAEGRITLRIEDDARVSQLLSSPLSLGARIVMILMDSVAYEHCDERNYLTMSKSF